MTPEQTALILKIAREDMRLRAEVRALRAILQTAASEKRAHLHWEEELKEIRLTPQYKDMAEKYESVFVQFQQVSDDNQVIELLQDIGTDDLLN